MSTRGFGRWRGVPARRDLRHSRRLRPDLDASRLEGRQLLAATILDNSDATGAFSRVGAWAGFSAGYLGNEITIAANSSGASTATWSFPNLQPGRYRVSATWSPTPLTPATNSPFQVYQDSTLLGSAAINQRATPADILNDNGANWQDLGGPYIFSGGTLSIRVNNQANGFVIADAVRLERVDQPEIAVSLDGNNIVDGSGAVDFGTAPLGFPTTRTFTVSNIGFADLSLGSISLPAGFSLASGFGSTTVAAGGSTTFTVRLDATAVGTPSGTLSFGNNDADENPFDFTLSGNIAQAAVGPDVNVSSNGQSINVGGTYSFGFATPGSVRQRTFTVTNVGSETLTLGDPVAVTGNFALVSGPALHSLSPGASTTFVVQLNTGTAGFFTGNVSFTNNDPDENPFHFAVSGAVGVGAGADIAVFDGSTEIQSGSAGIDLGATVVGAPILRLITIANTGDSSLNLNGVTLPAGFGVFQNFTSTSIEPGGMAALVISVDASAAGLPSGTMSILSNDADESPFLIPIKAVVAPHPGPEAQLLEGTREVVSGSGSVDFGSTSVGTPVVRTLTVRNLGNEDLTLGAISLPAGFSLATPFGATTLAPGASTSFAVRLDATVDGNFSGTATFGNNDADESPYRFSLSGLASTVRQANVVVSVAGTPIDDNTGVVSFGATTVGSPVTLDFVVKNTGNATLLALTPVVPAGFTIVAPFISPSIAPGASGVIRVRLNATAPGTFSGTFRFATNVPGKNPYDFTITGVVSSLAIGAASSATLSVVPGAMIDAAIGELVAAPDPILGDLARKRKSS